MEPESPSHLPTVPVPVHVLSAVLDFCFQAMPRYLDTERAARVVAVVQWDVTGPAGGRWQLVIDEGRCHVERDGTARPDVRLTASAPDVLAICLGQASAPRLAMTGRLRIRGNYLLAARMGAYFRPPAAAR